MKTAPEKTIRAWAVCLTRRPNCYKREPAIYEKFWQFCRSETGRELFRAWCRNETNHPFVRAAILGRLHAEKNP